MKNQARTQAMIIDATLPVLLALVAPCVLMVLPPVQDLCRRAAGARRDVKIVNGAFTSRAMNDYTELRFVKSTNVGKKRIDQHSYALTPFRFRCSDGID